MLRAVLLLCAVASVRAQTIGNGFGAGVSTGTPALLGNNFNGPHQQFATFPQSNVNAGGGGAALKRQTIGNAVVQIAFRPVGGGFNLFRTQTTFPTAVVNAGGGGAALKRHNTEDFSTIQAIPIGTGKSVSAGRAAQGGIITINAGITVPDVRRANEAGVEVELTPVEPVLAGSPLPIGGGSLTELSPMLTINLVNAQGLPQTTGSYTLRCAVTNADLSELSSSSSAFQQAFNVQATPLTSGVAVVTVSQLGGVAAVTAAMSAGDRFVCGLPGDTCDGCRVRGANSGTSSVGSLVISQLGASPCAEANWPALSTLGASLTIEVCDTVAPTPASVAPTPAIAGAPPLILTLTRQGTGLITSGIIECALFQDSSLTDPSSFFSGKLEFRYLMEDGQASTIKQFQPADVGRSEAEVLAQFQLPSPPIWACAQAPTCPAGSCRRTVPVSGSILGNTVPTPVQRSVFSPGMDQCIPSSNLNQETANWQPMRLAPIVLEVCDRGDFKRAEPAAPRTMAKRQTQLEIELSAVAENTFGRIVVLASQSAAELQFFNSSSLAVEEKTIQLVNRTLFSDFKATVVEAHAYNTGFAALVAMQNRTSNETTVYVALLDSDGVVTQQLTFESSHGLGSMSVVRRTGQFFVAWQDDDAEKGIKARVFRANGTPFAATVTLDSDSNPVKLQGGVSTNGFTLTFDLPDGSGNMTNGFPRVDQWISRVRTEDGGKAGANDRIAQGVFAPFFAVDDDTVGFVSFTDSSGRLAGTNAELQILPPAPPQMARTIVNMNFCGIGDL